MSKIKIDSINTLAKTKFLSLYDVEYTNKTGNKRNWTVSSRKDLDTFKDKLLNKVEDKIDAVVLIAKHIKEDKLVLIRQFRVPINDYIIELPAGLIDEGENFESTVRRELKEETGLDLIKIDFENTTKKAYASVGMTDESMAIVRCECEGVVSKENLEEDEDIETILVSKDEAKELLKSDENIDVKALLAIQNFIIG